MRLKTSIFLVLLFSSQFAFSSSNICIMKGNSEETATFINLFAKDRKF
jgi:hypothetical protein